MITRSALEKSSTLQDSHTNFKANGNSVMLG